MNPTLSKCLIVAGLIAAVPTVSAAMDLTADMKDAAGNAVGTVTVSQSAQTVVISADLKGLPAGAHGFHIHAKGSCTPDFKAAGGHFSPAGKGHGVNNPAGRHAGDLPNLHVGTDGTIKADVYSDAVTLKAGEASSLIGAAGSSFIIHARADSYGENPGAGGRIACGVISPPK